MKSIIFKSVTAAALAGSMWLVTSCNEDNGNYSYHDLDKVEIVTEGLGIQQEYVVDRGDRLTIAPDVYFNGKKVTDGDNSPLSYLWTLYSRSTGAGVDYSVDTLGTNRVLDAEFNRVGGSYTLQLTVTNREDGIETYYTVPCLIEEAISAGWMLLYERADRPGTSDVGLVVNPYVKKFIVNNKEFWNLYSSSNGGEPLQGAPVNIIHETIPMAGGGTPRIATTKEVVAVSTNDFTKVIDLSEMFYSLPDIREINWFGFSKTAGMLECLIADNTLYTLSGNSVNGVGYFGVPKQGSDIGELAPWCSNCLMMMESVVYDQTNGAFYYIPNNGVEFYSFGAQDPVVAKFDVNNTGGAKLLFGDWGANYYDHFLFSRGNERFLGIANFSATPTMPNLGLGWYDVTSSPDIADASAFAANYEGQYVYYGAGNKVYNLAYNSGKAASPVWTAPGAGEKVVCISTQKYHFRTLVMPMGPAGAIMPNVGNLIHIATWDEAKGEGKLYEYKINPASGMILTDEQSYTYTVPGKVKAMGWKYAMER